MASFSAVQEPAFGKVDLIALACCLLATFTAAALGAVASVNSPEFYAGLNRPSWAPPASVFGPVWSTLYLLMAIAAWLVWRQRYRANILIPLSLFGIQLLLNGLWTWLFFQWQMGTVAAAEIILLWVTILATILSFWRVSKTAAAMLLPYLLWVGYATALTISLVNRNPGVL